MYRYRPVTPEEAPQVGRLLIGLGVFFAILGAIAYFTPDSPRAIRPKTSALTKKVAVGIFGFVSVLVTAVGTYNVNYPKIMERKRAKVGAS